MQTPIRTAIHAVTGLSLTVSIACSPSVEPIQDDHARYARIAVNGEPRHVIAQDGLLHEVVGDLFGEHGTTDVTYQMDEVTYLPPVAPSKVIAVGLNYLSHLGDRPRSAEPPLFAKYPTSLIGMGQPIVIPSDANNLHYEGEMVLVIGDTASNVSAEDALNYVWGVTVGNDVSERDWQANDLQWFRAKGSDGFGPIGPFIARGLDPDNLALTTRVNGETRQEGHTSDLIFDVRTIVSYVSRYVTLYPGDLIFTGTPGTTMAMSPGEVVEIELEGVGILSNPVVRSESGTD